MRAEIIMLRQKIDTTFIYVTHDQTEAMTLGDRIVIMKDGVVQQIGTPQQVFDDPANIFVAGFIGVPQMNFFDAELTKDDEGYCVKLGDLQIRPSAEKQANLAKNNVEPQAITLGVRPEHITLAEKGANTIQGTVDVSEMMGSSVHLHLDSLDKKVIIIAQTMDFKGEYANGFNPGQEVAYTFGGNVLHMFSKETDENLEFSAE